MDGIYTEIMKQGGEEIIDILLRVYYVKWHGRWTLAVIVPLYKGQAVRTCKDFREISEKCMEG